MTGVDDGVLAAWVNAVLPTLGRPGIHGTVGRLASILATDHPEWRHRLSALDARASPTDPGIFTTDPDAQWIARLIA